MRTSKNIIRLNTSHVEEWIALRVNLYGDMAETVNRNEIDGLLSKSSLNPQTALVLGWSTEGHLEALLEMDIRTDHVPGSSFGLPVGYLEGIYVTPAFRRQGIATKLFSEAEKWCKDNRIAQIGSDALIDNEIGLEVHAKLGFSEVERSVHFIKSEGENNGN